MVSNNIVFLYQTILYFSNKQISIMVLESIIESVAEKQRNRLDELDYGMKREFVPNTKSLSSHALIISGIRRCGKSTLMMQMIKELGDIPCFYLNFESPQLYGLTISDFTKLDNIILKIGAKYLFLDELQVVEGWELYVRQKLDEGFKVIITGSNAVLLSQELGSKMTGRHIFQELFPFSYCEFLKFFDLQNSAESLSEFMLKGGFPDFLKTNDEEQLSTLFNDILIRDIVVRHGIKDVKSIQSLASYLMSNVGNRITATKLKQPLSVSATSTVMGWLSHLELSYLVFFLPVFSYSVKAQLINPRKVYAVDLGMLNAVSLSLTKDLGRKLENLIYLHLRRKYKELYYFDNNGECDFVAVKKGNVEELVQVCYELTPDNLDRELNGLFNAMKYFNMKTGTIITFNNTDIIIKDNMNVDVIPAYEYLLKRNYSASS